MTNVKKVITLTHCYTLTSFPESLSYPMTQKNVPRQDDSQCNESWVNSAVCHVIQLATVCSTERKIYKHDLGLILFLTFVPPSLKHHHYLSCCNSRCVLRALVSTVALLSKFCAGIVFFCYCCSIVYSIYVAIRAFMSSGPHSLHHYAIKTAMFIQLLERALLESVKFFFFL